MKNTYMNNVSERIKKIEIRFKRLKNFVSREKWDNVDKMLFSFEQLPIRGKEYWFLLFTSNEPENGKQFMVTLGNQRVKKYIVDGCEILNGFSDDRHIGPFSFWFYDKNFYRSRTVPSLITMDNKEMSANFGKTEFSIKGEYPRYEIKLKENGRKICDLITKKGSDHKKYDVSEFFKGGIGFGNVNLLLDSEGKLNGSSFGGQGYLQKVVITAPLPSVPWYWGRVCFSDKSVLTFLQPHISLSRLSKNFATSAYFYNSNKKKEYFFEKVNVRKFGKINKQFLVHGKGKDIEFTLLTDNYAKKEFKINSIGKLNYEQNLVRVNSFSMESGKKMILKKDTGDGIGIIEDAYGYII